MKKLIWLIVALVIIVGGVFWLKSKGWVSNDRFIFESASLTDEFEFIYPNSRTSPVVAGTLLNLLSTDSIQSLGDGIYVDFSSGHYLWTVPNVPVGNNYFLRLS